MKYALNILCDDADEVKSVLAKLEETTSAKKTTKKKSQVEDDETDDEDEDEAPPAKKKGRPAKKAKMTDDEDEDADESEDDEDADGDDDDSEDEDDAPPAKSKVTKQDVVKALQDYSKRMSGGEQAKGRKAARALMKKYDAESPDDLDKSDYAAIIAECKKKK